MARSPVLDLPPISYAIIEPISMFLLSISKRWFWCQTVGIDLFWIDFQYIDVFVVDNNIKTSTLMSKSFVIIVKKLPYRWNWEPWLHWSRAFSVPYYDWRAIAKFLSDIWKASKRLLKVLDEHGPPPDGISIYEAIEVSSVKNFAPLIEH